jgi:putative thioredoxin
MLDISLQNFEADLIAASVTQPMLLDIWAPWCGPCKALGPVLEKLEEAYAGRFTLAKLNSDEQPEIAGQLSQMFGVRSIPFCVMFKGGQPVDGFVGALPEAQVRSFLDKHVPSVEQSATEQDVAEAELLLAEGDVDTALEKLQQAVAQNARLAACGHWLAACERVVTARSPEQLAVALAADKRDFDARFELAQHHFAAQRFTQAMDELLEILMRDKSWRDGLARKTYVAVLEAITRPSPKRLESTPSKTTLELAGNQPSLTTDPVVDSYRRRLSMVVF